MILSRFHIRRPTALSPSLLMVAVNAGLFVVMRIIAIVMRLGGDGRFDAGRMIEALALPADAAAFLRQPWSLLSYMFVQYDPMHLIMNMLWLLMFGRIAERLVSGRRFYTLYVAGGLAGASLYLGASAMGLYAPVPSGHLVGASASILSVMTATVVMRPSMPVRLLFFGEASLKVVGLIALLLLIISVGPENYGSHAAHCGGLVCGACLALRWRGERDEKRGAQPVALRKPWASAAMPGGGAANGTINVTSDGSEAKDATLDDLLDKIRLSGFASLTERERERLFKISSDLQNVNRR